jgi:PAS domain S-box-containing protein
VTDLHTEDSREDAAAGLRRERDKLLAIVESITDEIWFADADGTVSLVNPAVWREFGAVDGKPAQAIAERFSVYRADGTLRPPAEAPPLRALRGETIREEEEIVRTPAGGELRHRLVSGAPVRDGDGTIIGSVCVVRDVTERHRVEQALREGEERFRALFEEHLAPMLLIDPASGSILDANAQAAEFYGYSREQLGDMHIEQLNQLPPDQVATERRKAVDRGQNLFTFPHRLASGEIRFVDVYSSPVTIQGRSTLFSIIHDVTERKRTAEALERTRQTLAEAQEIAHLGSFEYDLAAGTTVWSEEEYRIYGLDPAKPSPPYDIMLARCIHPSDAALLHETFSHAMETGSVYELEHRIVRPDGSVRWVYDRAHAHVDEDGRLLRYVGATLDITERKASELALLESEAREAAQQERERLARDLHDSVSQAIFAAALKAEALDIAGESGGAAAPAATEVCRLCKAALADLRTMLLELRGVALENIPLQQLLRQLAESTEGRTSAQVELNVHETAGAPPGVHVALYRVTQEALNNAVRHARATHIRVDARVSADEAVVEIHDDGRGFRRTESGPGHLGLRMMRERATEIGADLSVASVVGQGTSVVLRWRDDQPAGA